MFSTPKKTWQASDPIAYSDDIYSGSPSPSTSPIAELKSEHERQVEYQDNLRRSAQRLKSSWESICRRYGRDFSGQDDIIDLQTGEVIQDNGHLKSLHDHEDADYFSSGEEALEDEDMEDALDVENDTMLRSLNSHHLMQVMENNQRQNGLNAINHSLFMSDTLQMGNDLVEIFPSKSGMRERSVESPTLPNIKGDEDMALLAKNKDNVSDIIALPTPTTPSGELFSTMNPFDTVLSFREDDTTANAEVDGPLQTTSMVIADAVRFLAEGSQGFVPNFPLMNEDQTAIETNAKFGEMDLPSDAAMLEHFGPHGPELLAFVNANIKDRTFKSNITQHEHQDEARLSKDCKNDETNSQTIEVKESEKKDNEEDMKLQSDDAIDGDINDNDREMETATENVLERNKKDSEETAQIVEKKATPEVEKNNEEEGEAEVTILSGNKDEKMNIQPSNVIAEEEKNEEQKSINIDIIEKTSLDSIIPMMQSNPTSEHAMEPDHQHDLIDDVPFSKKTNVPCPKSNSINTSSNNKQTEACNGPISNIAKAAGISMEKDNQLDKPEDLVSPELEPEPEQPNCIDPDLADEMIQESEEPINIWSALPDDPFLDPAWVDKHPDGEPDESAFIRRRLALEAHAMKTSKTAMSLNKAFETPKISRSSNNSILKPSPRNSSRKKKTANEDGLFYTPRSGNFLDTLKKRKSQNNLHYTVESPTKRQYGSPRKPNLFMDDHIEGEDDLWDLESEDLEVTVVRKIINERQSSTLHDIPRRRGEFKIKAEEELTGFHSSRCGDIGYRCTKTVCMLCIED